MSQQLSRNEELPTFDLECSLDKAHDPSEVTVFVDDDELLYTHWISADIDTAVPLEEIA